MVYGVLNFASSNPWQTCLVEIHETQIWNSWHFFLNPILGIAGWEEKMKQVVGMVVSNKMQKSVVVAVDRLFYHKVYDRYVKRTSKFMAHDENNLCNIGDKVSSMNLQFYLVYSSSLKFLCMLFLSLDLYSNFCPKVNESINFVMLFRFDWILLGLWASINTGLLLKFLRRHRYMFHCPRQHLIMWTPAL